MFIPSIICEQTKQRCFRAGCVSLTKVPKSRASQMSRVNVNSASVCVSCMAVWSGNVLGAFTLPSTFYLTLLNKYSDEGFIEPLRVFLCCITVCACGFDLSDRWIRLKWFGITACLLHYYLMCATTLIDYCECNYRLFFPSNNKLTFDAFHASLCIYQACAILITVDKIHNLKKICVVLNVIQFVCKLLWDHHGNKLL